MVTATGVESTERPTMSTCALLVPVLPTIAEAEASRGEWAAERGECGVRGESITRPSGPITDTVCEREPEP